jgi:hypothetical protein
METATFHRDGGALSAEVSVGFAPESMFYDLRMFSPKKQKFLVVAEGVNVAEGPNTHVLPGPNSTKDQRIVAVLAQFAGLVAGQPFRVGLDLFQDGQKIGSCAVEEHATDVSAFVVCEIRLLEA